MVGSTLSIINTQAVCEACVANVAANDTLKCALLWNVVSFAVLVVPGTS